MPCSINFSLTLQTEILSTVTLDFLKHMIILKSFMIILKSFKFRVLYDEQDQIQQCQVVSWKNSLNKCIDRPLELMLFFLCFISSCFVISQRTMNFKQRFLFERGISTKNS